MSHWIKLPGGWLTSVQILILALAASLSIHAWVEGVAVALVILLNISVGFQQEYASIKSLESLKELGSPTARGIRDGQSEPVAPTSLLVPGDIIELERGDKVPADVRIIESMNFEVDEKIITGETMPVKKRADVVLPAETGTADRKNLAFSGCKVEKGHARAIVYATGSWSEVGHIAEAVQGSSTPPRPNAGAKASWLTPFKTILVNFWYFLLKILGLEGGTPLQRKLSALALILLLVALFAAFIVFAVNNWRANQEVIIYAVATGLCMIPISLVAVLTITMNGGTRAMKKRKVLVRNANKLEAIGAVTG
jgi:P-type Na+/K+ transporter